MTPADWVGVAWLVGAAYGAVSVYRATVERADGPRERACVVIAAVSIGLMFGLLSFLLLGPGDDEEDFPS